MENLWEMEKRVEREELMFEKVREGGTFQMREGDKQTERPTDKQIDWTEADEIEIGSSDSENL